MRFLVVILVALSTLSGCPLARTADEAGGTPMGDDDNSGMAPGQAACVRDTDCELASASCCECPSFAANVADPNSRACEGVVCEMPPTCTNNVRAACDTTRNECVVACVEMTCAAVCPDGFRIDPATGCLSCECATPALAGCSTDDDCVQTRDDCCGCAMGGADTAVLASELAAHEANLNMGAGCAPTPACPGVNQCDPQEVPRCIQGQCELTSATPPAGACTGSCPDGEACFVNRDPIANQVGVGVCAPP